MSAGKGHIHVDYVAHTTHRGLQAGLRNHDTQPVMSRGLGVADTRHSLIGWSCSALDPLGVNKSNWCGENQSQGMWTSVTAARRTVHPEFIRTRGSLTHGVGAQAAPRVRGAGRPGSPGPQTDLSTVWLMKPVSSPAAPSSCCRIFSRLCCCSCRRPASGDRRAARSSC